MISGRSLKVASPDRRVLKPCGRIKSTSIKTALVKWAKAPVNNDE